MSGYFLTSHARGPDRSWVVRFIADLLVRLPFELGEPVGRNVARSGPVMIDEPLAAATAPCMVAMLSDQYFDDVRCGRQWAVFAARISLDEARRSGSAGHCLVPVVWRRFDPTPATEALLPASLVGDRRPDRQGLHELMRTRSGGPDNGYAEVVRTVASRVAAAHRRHLSPWPTTAVDLLAPAFGAGDGGETGPLPAAPGRVAISYDQADQPWANWIRDLLHQVGYQVVLAEQRRGPHDSPSRLIAEARDMADRVVAILSRHSLRGSDPDVEWMEALGDSPENRGRLVRIQVDRDPPRLAPPFPPPVSLYGLQEAAIGQLLRAVVSP